MTADLVTLLVRDVCESEPADPDHPDTCCINVHRLRELIERRFEIERDSQPTPKSSNQRNRPDHGLVLSAELLSKALQQQCQCSPGYRSCILCMAATYITRAEASRAKQYAAAHVYGELCPPSLKCEYCDEERSAGETSCSECERLRTVVKTLLTEVATAEGDYGIGLAMTKAEKAIGWSVMDQSPENGTAEWQCVCGQPLASKDAGCPKCAPPRFACTYCGKNFNTAEVRGHHEETCASPFTRTPPRGGCMACGGLGYIDEPGNPCDCTALSEP